MMKISNLIWIFLRQTKEDKLFFKIYFHESQIDEQTNIIVVVATTTKTQHHTNNDNDDQDQQHSATSNATVENGFLENGK